MNMKKYLFLEADYDFRDNNIYLYGRDLKTSETKTFIIGDFLAYFYVDENTDVPYNYSLIATKPGYTALMGERLKKIMMSSPGDVGRFRNKFTRVWESDVNFEQRFLIDLGIKFFFYIPLDVVEKSNVVSYNQITVRLKEDDNGLDDGRDIVKYRYFYFDIEVRVKDDGRMADVQQADEPIISIGLTTKHNNKRILFLWHKDEVKRIDKVNENLIVAYYTNEREMIKAFFDMIHKIDPDIYIGWYVDFDINYTINRCNTLGIPSRFSRVPFEDVMSAYNEKNVEREGRDRIKGRMVFDLKKGYERIANTTQNSLNDALINEGFEAKHGKAYEVTQYLETDRDKLIEYNDYDVEALKILDEKVYITQFYELVRKISGLNNYDMCLYTQVATDPIALRLAKQEGIVLPNRGDGDSKKYEGAVVFDPISGFHKWVFILDLRRFYPSIFMSLNLSRETICEDGDINCGNFRTKSTPVGLTSKIYMQFWKMRERIEKRLSAKIPGTDKYVLTPGSPEHTVAKKSKDAIKGFSNAIYGMTGYPKARLYERRVAEKITEVAREIIILVRDTINEHFPEEAQVIYGDTDSVFVKAISAQQLDDVLVLMKRVEEICNQTIRDFMRKKYNAEPHEFVGLDAEKVLKAMILLDVKKRYAGKVCWEKGQLVNYTYVKGFEMKRRDSSEITGNMQENVLTMILDEVIHEEIVSYVNNIIKQMKKAEYNLEDIAIPIGIAHKLEDYGGVDINGRKKTPPPQIRGAMYANEHFGTTFGQGSRVMMLYVADVKGFPPTEVVCFDRETKLPELTIRKDLMIEKIVEAKVKHILDVVGIKWKNCLIGGKLSDYY